MSLWGADCSSSQSEDDPTLIEARSAVLRLASDPASVGLARRWLRSVCNQLLSRERCDDAEIVLTELVGNAIRHTDGLVELLIGRCVDGAGLRLVVRDESTRPVTP